MPRKFVRSSRFAAFVALLFLALSLPMAAHDIPVDASVQVYFKPAGSRLNVLVRVPLRAMQDVEFPQRADSYLDLARLDGPLRNAAKLWVSDYLDVYENGVLLPKPRIVDACVALESDHSFASYDQALAHIAGPKLSNTTNVFAEQTMLDVQFEYPIQSGESRFSIHPAFDRLAVHVVTSLSFVSPSGAVREFEFVGDPGIIRLDPRWSQVLEQFARLGFSRVFRATDILLFLLCIVIPLRRIDALIPVVVSFSVAYSITLVAAAHNLAPDMFWFPPLIETLLATLILIMALENIIAGPTLRWRLVLTFIFGLAEGFALALALRPSMQLAGSHPLASLLSFNAGIEFGQLVILALLTPALRALFRYVVAERMGTILLSAIAAHTAWHWMIDRYQVLSQYRIRWTALEPAPVAKALRLSMLIVIAAAGVWLVLGLLWPRWRRIEKDPTLRVR